MKKLFSSLLIGLTLTLCGATTNEKAKIHTLLQQAVQAHKDGNEAKATEFMSQANLVAKKLDLSDAERSEFHTYGIQRPGLCECCCLLGGSKHQCNCVGCDHGC